MEKNKPLHPDLCRKHHLLQAGLFIHTWTIRTLKCFLEKDIPLHPSIHPSFSTKSESKQARENVKFSRVKYFTATLLSGRNKHFISREHFCALDNGYPTQQLPRLFFLRHLKMLLNTYDGCNLKMNFSRLFFFWFVFLRQRCLSYAVRCFSPRSKNALIAT